ncbi:MAG: hypothetical protein ACP5N9_01455 [Candidatus Bilamarchaeum sp.]|jgi:hypothetical protein
MQKPRLAYEIVLEKPSFDYIMRASKLLEDNAIISLTLPFEDRNINTHLVVETKDLERSLDILRRYGFDPAEKQVLVLEIENQTSKIAEVARKMSNEKINLLYAFAVSVSSATSYLLLGTSDNKRAIDII